MNEINASVKKLLIRNQKSEATDGDETDNDRDINIMCLWCFAGDTKYALHVIELPKSQMEIMLLINMIYLVQYIEAKQFHYDLVPIRSYINKNKYFSRPIS